MTLFAAVLNLSAWDTNDSLALLACGGYIVVFAAIGVRGSNGTLDDMPIEHLGHDADSPALLNCSSLLPESLASGHAKQVRTRC